MIVVAMATLNNTTTKHLNKTNMTEPIDTNKYQVWFQDTDPDTGEICQTKLICIAESKEEALWLVEALAMNNEEPNRDFIMAIDYPLKSGRFSEEDMFGFAFYIKNGLTNLEYCQKDYKDHYITYNDLTVKLK